MTYPRVPGYTPEQVKAYYDAGLPRPMPPTRPNPNGPVNGGPVPWHVLRDLALFCTGMTGLVVALATHPAPPLIFVAVALIAMPLFLAAPPDRRVGTRTKGCVCRGCRRPGQRYIWERLLRKPRWAVPASHAEASLGIAHGRLHDLRRKEAEAGVMHSAEVIQHFALPEDRWIEEPDAIWDHWAGGCHDDPNLTVTVWG